MKRTMIQLIALGAMFICGCAHLGAQSAIEIKKAEGAEIQEKWDVTINGALFTSYCADEKQFFHKPIFHPVMSAAGNEINRGIPPLEGEDKDHIHHQSVWFNYGAVNGMDYWNLKMTGRRIVHREIAAEGDTLKIGLDWIDNDKKVILKEQKNVTFGAAEGVRWMDHDITLTATDAPVQFGDSKEGAFAFRVSGRLTPRGGTGKYTNAEGLEGNYVWGKMSPWVALAGAVAGPAGDEELTVVIYSHPTTVNHPPYWHARDYGLFAANPFGRHEYDKVQDKREWTLEAGQSVHVRFALAIYTGKPDKAKFEADYAEFQKK